LWRLFFLKNLFMGNTTTLPLLVKGYNTDLNGVSNNTLPVTAGVISWNNVFDSGRGNVIALDAVETGRPQVYVADTGATATISVAGVQVISGVNASDFAPYANPGNYYITPITQPGGQTLALQLSGGSGSHGLQVLAFYDNQYATPDFQSRLNYSRLKRKYQSFFKQVITVDKNVQSEQFVIPQAQGNVVGIEFVAYLNTGGNNTDLGLSTFSAYINGTSIMENVLSIYGMNACTRPTIFPIFIKGGNTLSFSINSSNCAAAPNFTVGLKVYFDASND
jgi:hypothetical protein